MGHQELSEDKGKRVKSREFVMDHETHVGWEPIWQHTCFEK